MPNAEVIVPVNSMAETGPINPSVVAEAIATIEEKKVSIFNLYQIENDARLWETHPELTEAEKKHYIAKQNQTFLSEYVNKSGYESIGGILLDDGTMQMMGTNVTSMWRHSATREGATSRIKADGIGMELINQELHRNGTAYWISPAKEGNWGFTYMFKREAYSPELKGYPFVEYPLRYDDTLGNLEGSYDVFARLAYLTNNEVVDRTQFNSPESFLYRPIFSSVNFPDSLNQVLEILHIDPTEVMRSKLFAETVMEKLKPFMDNYFNYVAQMAQTPKNSQEYLEYKAAAKQELGKMFEEAQNIKDFLEMQRTLNHSITSFVEKGFGTQSTFKRHRQPMDDRGPMVRMSQVGCEGISDVARTSPYDLHNALDYMARGVSFEAAIADYETKRYPDYECKCGQKFRGELVYKPWTWRKVCSNCGFKFNCTVDTSPKYYEA